MEQEIKMKMIELYNLLDNIGWDVSGARRSIEDLETAIKENEENSIKDINNFKRELKRDGLYSDKIENFIDNYMRYYNN